ncbi:MAG: 50S ribosomal protein L11 methyltransferase [Desulfosarcinaceae bacterium]|nr:50S ribosomal protein L11 methyltransferase [Desulfosarcinaceae bacterium]
MKWVAARVVLDGDGTELAADLIADRFFDLGLKGVVMDDPDLAPAEGWGLGAQRPSSDRAVTGYFENDQCSDGRCQQLERALAVLAEREGFHYALTYSRVDDTDWSEAWKAFFYPEIISPGLVVKPSWRDYLPQAGQVVVEIDPGMAFGTGTHPTTVMCLELIQKYLQPGTAFLDVGTGSGILMIAAAKLGARQITGVDNDPTASAVARGNLAANDIPPERTAVHTGSLVNDIEGCFDLIAANILAEVIVELAPALPAILSPGGRVICSGVIRSTERAAVDGLNRAGLTIIETRRKEEWVAMVAECSGVHDHR